MCMVPRARSEWLAGGVRARDLCPPSYRRSSHAFFAPTSTGRAGDGLLTTQRILDAVPVVSNGGALGGWAAAFVWGVDWLDGVARNGPLAVPVHVGSRTGRSGRQVRFIQDELTDDEIESCHDIAVTSLPRTAFDAVRWANGLSDAVAALDAMLRFTVLSRHDISHELERRAGWRGVNQARAALDLADPYVLSSAESRLRVLYVTEAALPPPLVNPWVFDGSWNLLGRPDLFDPVVRHAVEYDGAYHEDPQQVLADRLREKRFTDNAIVVSRVVAADFSSHLTLSRRLRLDHQHARQNIRCPQLRVIRADGTSDLEDHPVPVRVRHLIESTPV